MRVLCTGGAGYVGSACLRWLLAHGHDAHAYDDLSAGHAEAVPSGRLLLGDVRDTEGLARRMRETGCDAVMHFAALASVPESIRDPSAYYEQNLIGSRSVLEAARSAGVQRLVFSSTAAVYSFPASEAPLAEEGPCVPATPYGASKLAAERMIADYARAYGIRGVALRYFNASGASPDGGYGESRRDETHLIPRALAAALPDAAPLPIYGTELPTKDGTCVRDFVHVNDIAWAHQLALRSTGGPFEVFNIGSGTGYSVREVLAACERAVGHAIPWKEAPPRPGDPPILVADPRRIRAALGWRPTHSLSRIVETAWAWHRSQSATQRCPHRPARPPG